MPGKARVLTPGALFVLATAPLAIALAIAQTAGG